METQSAIKKDVHQVITKWEGKMHFTSEVNEHTIHLDKLQQHGGDNFGPRPKPLILSAIGGCAGMEIMGILDKMRLKIDAFEMEVSGELTDTQPKMYKEIILKINIKSAATEHQKIERAVHLAIDKYCGVIAMARMFASLHTEINFVN
ncbi:MAG: OsmC family protein [Bacteroidetes bacterium]|nr:OsmC family protein [Bacteroidota bacterium]